MEQVIPFKNFNEKFNYVLYRDYLVPLSEWFFYSSVDGVFLKTTNSSWEAAYATRYLIELSRYSESSQTDKEYSSLLSDDFYIKTKDHTRNTIEWLTTSPRVKEIKVKTNVLREHLKKSQKEILYCWEKNTWDTAVVINAVISAVDYFGDTVLYDNDTVSDIISRAVAWLVHEFEEKQKEYSTYSFGVNDFAPILSVLIHLLQSKWTSKIFDGSIKTLKKYFIEMCDHIVDFFYQCQEFYRINDEIVAVHWGDNFITSEVSASLVYYFNYVCFDDKGQFKRLDMDKTEKIYKTLKLVGHWYEISQSDDGLWGSHDDTMQSLRAYLRITSGLQDFECRKNEIGNYFDVSVYENSMNVEDHKVFKSIRWLLDEKQCVDDGSYLHTSYLTVFFAQTLFTIFKEWKCSKDADGNEKEIYIIYDEVLGISPVRSANERTRNIKLEIEKNHLENKVKQQKEDFRTFLVLAFIILAIILVVVTAISTNAIALIQAADGSIQFSIIDERLFGIIDVVTLAVTILLTYFVLRKFKD